MCQDGTGYGEPYEPYYKVLTFLIEKIPYFEIPYFENLKVGDLLYMTHYRPKAGTEEGKGDNQTYTTVQNRGGNTSG